MTVFMQPEKLRSSETHEQRLVTTELIDRILTTPLLFQINLFLPEWISPEPGPLRLLFARSSASTMEELVMKVGTWHGSSFLLITGVIVKDSSSKKTMEEKITIGAIIRGSWRKTTSPGNEQDEERNEIFLFQLKPVHRVYRLRGGQLPSEPILQPGGIGIGCSVDDEKDSASEMGLTRLVVKKGLDEMIFEHGKRDGVEGIFEGVSRFGIGAQAGIMRIHITRLEVWGL